MKRMILAGLVSAAISVPGFAHEGHEHMGKDAMKGEAKVESVTVKGEVLDMACYLDHGATGAKHADCAKTCITSNLPVGLKGDDGKTYLLIGEHKPINQQMAQYAGKTITVKGKSVSRDGFNMLENVEVVH